MVVFDTKVINHQRKDDVAGDVAEETGGGSLVKAMGGKVQEKTGLGELACLHFNPYIVLSMRKRR